MTCLENLWKSQMLSQISLMLSPVLSVRYKMSSPHNLLF